MNNGSQQDVPPYVAQGAPKVNFNVGSGYIGNRAHNGPSTTIKQRSRTPRKRFGRAKPGTANENGTQQGVPPLRATSGAKVNADVRNENERCGTEPHKGTTATRIRE